MRIAYYVFTVKRRLTKLIRVENQMGFPEIDKERADDFWDLWILTFVAHQYPIRILSEDVDRYRITEQEYNILIAEKRWIP